MRMWYGGNGRDKYYCSPCDHVAKAKTTPSCPLCGEAMTFMTDVWRPGRKGRKTRLWDKRVPQHRMDAARLTSSPQRYRVRRWTRNSGVTEEWVRSRTEKND